MYKILISPDDINIDINESEYILDATIKNNLNLPYGCKNGLCGSCKCKVVSGKFRLDDYDQRVLSKEELTQGYTLLCKSFAQSDLELYLPDILNKFPVKILPAKVVAILKTQNVAIIKMKIPPNQSFNFFAGQYIEVILSGKHRSYSIANGFLKDNIIEIHVKYHEQGVFSEFVWNELQEGHILRFKGALGNFKLSQTQSPLIFVCTGTGFAPIKAILEYCVMNKEKRQISLYWGNRWLNDFYLLEVLDEFSRELNININLCLSRETKQDFYHGYVTTVIQNHFNDLSNHEIYACGNLNMIENVYELSTNKLNLDKKRFYSDVFTASV